MRKAAARLLLLTMAVMPVLAFFSLLSVGCNVTPGLIDTDGWLAGWANRVEIMIDHAQIDASLSNFPVLVHISESSGRNARNVSFIFDELGSDSNRKRIAITTSDGIKQCYAEIEVWNSASEEALIWVKVPSIARDVDTKLYLYYDKNHPDNNSMVGDLNSTPAQNVWDANFTMVQHLEEDGNGTAGEFRDSTSNTHNSVQGSQTTTPASLDPEPGVIFDGNNDFIEVADSNDLSVPITGNLTISAWIRPDVNNFPKTCVSDPVSEGGYVHWLGKSEYGDRNQCEWVFRMYSKTGSSRPNRISFYVFNRDGAIGVGSYFQDDVVPGTWIYVTGVIDASKTYIYKNGLLRDSDTYKMIITPVNGTAPLRIGHVEDDSPPGYFLGAIREVHISNVVRSNAWIKASYASEGDSLLYFGLPTTSTDVTTPPTMTSMNPN